jgi:hypothetical protein
VGYAGARRLAEPPEEFRPARRVRLLPSDLPSGNERMNVRPPAGLLQVSCRRYRRVLSSKKPWVYPHSFVLLEYFWLMRRDTHPNSVTNLLFLVILLLLVYLACRQCDIARPN